MLGDEDGAGHGRGDRGDDVLVGGGGEVLAGQPAGPVVDQHVDVVGHRGDLVGEGAYRRRVRQVAAQGVDAARPEAADLVGDVLGRRQIPGGEQDIVAAAGEEEGECPAEVPGGSGDDHAPAAGLAAGRAGLIAVLKCHVSASMFAVGSGACGLGSASGRTLGRLNAGQLEPLGSNPAATRELRDPRRRAPGRAEEAVPVDEHEAHAYRLGGEEVLRESPSRTASPGAAPTSASAVDSRRALGSSPPSTARNSPASPCPSRTRSASAVRVPVATYSGRPRADRLTYHVGVGAQRRLGVALGEQLA